VVDKQSWTQLWVQHSVDKPSRVAQVCAAAYRRHPHQPGTATVVLDRTGYRGYVESICLSALQGTTAQTEQAIYLPMFEEPERTRTILRSTHGPLRLLISDPTAQRRVDKLLTRYPDLRGRVTTVPMTIKY
jgi:ribosomal protein S28E/S33